MWIFLNAFWRTGLTVSIVYGLIEFYFDGSEGSYFKIALLGFFAGFVAGLIAFEKSRKFTQDRPLMPGEILIDEGFAERDGKRGWFYLTNTRFFYISPDEKPTLYSPFTPNGESFSIMFPEIASVETEYKLGVFPKQLVLNLKNGVREEFVVDNVKHLSRRINKTSGLLLKAP